MMKPGTRLKSNVCEAELMIIKAGDSDESIEVLCVKTGEGSLYCNDEELMTKDTKKLPSSD